MGGGDVASMLSLKNNGGAGLVLGVVFTCLVCACTKLLCRADMMRQPFLYVVHATASGVTDRHLPQRA